MSEDILAKHDLSAAQEPETIDSRYAGTMQISVVSSIGLIPVENATVTISYTGDPESPLEVLTTDSSGQTPTVTLPAPPLELSLNPEAEEQPYAEYNITVTAEGASVLGTGNGWSKSEHDYTTSVCETRRGRMLTALLPNETAETVTVHADWNGTTYSKTINLHK